MRHPTRRFATAAAVAAVLTGATTLAAPAASAVTPGAGFQYWSLNCQTWETAGGDGTLACTGTQAGTWRAKVKCSFGFTYYGNWQHNNSGGTWYSTADSNCYWGVSDISLTTST
ncbi:hypothetical protein [Saccharothrix syringae]|uniref:Streptomyces killer toxin-like beta/gamma crystallin domain-containing protein n=1 Tax=Saccharothrix syringae TaxID=103733 RepID=A0A5Q0GZI9_SACSY|nr:hypothetical protein [Saccharothrix syringae]QFZ19075.1 hypothetical protein EKG83_17905 [Saccharothrix syringae]